MFLLIAGGVKEFMVDLILTNGDSASDLLMGAGKDGQIVPWRDSLHEGPLSALSVDGSDYDHFQTIRSQYWSERGVGDFDSLKASYVARDGLIATHDHYERIELWFEHDLYDQLQLIEILTRLYHLGRFENVYLVQAETYLGMQTPDTILNLSNLMRPVGEQMMAIADLAWQSVSHSTPEKLAEFVTLKPAGFPFLTQALVRLLEELPGLDGLSRTQRQILYSLDRGVNRAGMLFARCQAMEAAQFWGDLGFFHELSGLQYCKKPVLDGFSSPFSFATLQDGDLRKAFIQSELSLTEFGREVLAEQSDFSDHNEINRYLGGCLIGPQALWRWAWQSSSLMAPAALN